MPECNSKASLLFKVFYICLCSKEGWIRNAESIRGKEIMMEFLVKGKDSIRLDKFLMGKFPAVSYGLLQRYFRENKIKVDGKKKPLNTYLTTGNCVRVFFPETIGAARNIPHFFQARDILQVVYENESVLIGNKPAGVISIDESGKIADTFENRVRRYLYERKHWNPEEAYAPHLCHRLDTGTSGLLLTAKTQETQQQLDGLIREQKLMKEYLCVTYGHPQKKAAELRGYLLKDARMGKVSIHSHAIPRSKKITTRYETLAVSGPLALLRVIPVTGRTHQIRAHLASIECPVLGDGKYGKQSVNRKYKMKYQALCAWRISFPEIADGPCMELSRRTFQTEMPWYATQLLDHVLQ